MARAGLPLRQGDFDGIRYAVAKWGRRAGGDRRDRQLRARIGSARRDLVGDQPNKFRDWRSASAVCADARFASSSVAARGGAGSIRRCAPMAARGRHRDPVRRAANRITMQGQFRKRHARKEAPWRQDADDARSCLAYRPIFPARRCRSQLVVAGSHQANGPNPIKSAYGLRNAHKPGAYWTNLPGCRCSPPRRRPSTRCRTLSARSPRRRNPFAWRRSSRRSSPIG
ncbi:hypothetical protein BCC1697_004081 [Burkholderia gladioli]